MKKFMDEDFLLKTETAKAIYHGCAKELPIIDYHCHLNPKEIFENKRFSNIYEVWLSGDHYKWRIMRSNGVDEKYITGNASPREKFQKFAEALPKAIGNPIYHWCHLELKNYFGFDGVLNGDTADEVWDICEKKLAEENMSARGLISQSNVAFIGTTDDPLDNLEWHKKIAADESFKTVVAPTFRPDKALNIEKPDWCQYIEKLSEVCGYEISTFTDLKNALCDRIDYFFSCGCKASDHGLDYMMFVDLDDNACEKIMKKALRGKTLSLDEVEGFKTNLLIFCATEYAKRGIVMQLHYNCLRNTNSKMLELIGVDAGFDCIGPKESIAQLAKLFDRLYSEDALPKTVVYSLDATDDAALDCLIGAFQGTECAGKLQHGSAWWFNDNKVGMQNQLISLANLSLLGNFIGMLTDSRSFLSYARHEYFRRILCDLIGDWVENGEFPADGKTLDGIVRGICCENAQRYFNLREEN